MPCSILRVCVCKKMKDLLDAILLLGNTLTIHKNTTRSHYVMLGLVKLELDMYYDTQVRVSKTNTRFIVTKCARAMENQNAHAFWRRKIRTHYGEPQKMFWYVAREMNKKNSLHHQDLGPIVIFQHHQEQHLKQPCVTFQEHDFSLCCNMDTIRRL